MIESLLDSRVITKETLLSFETLPSDPERAVGPAQTRSHQGLPLVVNGVSCWVRSQMEDGGGGGTSDLVKVKRRESGLKPQAHRVAPGPRFPHHRFNKTKQHTRILH